MLPAGRRMLMMCYTLEFLALAVWIGGLVVIVASVIPAVFNTFGMEEGGRFLARVFNGYNRVIAAAVLVLVASGAWRLWAGMHGTTEAKPTRPELVLMTAMIAIACLITFVLAPKTISLQEAAFAARGDTARKAAYDTFFQVHHIARGLYVINLALAMALTIVKLRRWLIGSNTGKF
jgi:uncharacterized membrane protein